MRYLIILLPFFIIVEPAYSQANNHTVSELFPDGESLNSFRTILARLSIELDKADYSFELDLINGENDVDKLEYIMQKSFEEYVLDTKLIEDDSGNTVGLQFLFQDGVTKKFYIEESAIKDFNARAAKFMLGQIEGEEIELEQKAYTRAFIVNSLFGELPVAKIETVRN
jgi:ABC-type maltose transport system permease subunit